MHPFIYSLSSYIVHLVSCLLSDAHSVYWSTIIGNLLTPSSHSNPYWHPFRLYDWMATVAANMRHKPFAFHLVFSPPGIFITSPDAIEHVLKTNFDNYVKGSYVKDKLHDMLGKSHSLHTLPEIPTNDTHSPFIQATASSIPTAKHGECNERPLQTSSMSKTLRNSSLPSLSMKWSCSRSVYSELQTKASSLICKICSSDSPSTDSCASDSMWVLFLFLSVPSNKHNSFPF